MSHQIYRIKRKMGAVCDYLHASDTELVRKVMEQLGVAALFEVMKNIPLWFNGGASRGGMMRTKVLKFGDGTFIATPVLLEMHPALWDERFPERHADARATLLHEIAHFISIAKYGSKLGGGHGQGWKQVMRMLGEPATRCHEYEYVVSSRKARVKVEYRCQSCGSVFTFGRALKNEHTRTHIACSLKMPHFGKVVRI